MDRDNENKQANEQSTVQEDRRLFMDIWPAESSPIIDLDEEEVVARPPAETRAEKSAVPSETKESKQEELFNSVLKNDEWAAESTPTFDLDEKR